jgi:hypothetical protein
MQPNHTEKPDHAERRKEPRFPIEAGATVEVSSNGKLAGATTVDMSGSGVLLDFEEPVALAPGDPITCEFRVSHDSASPLPYWGVGKVIRVTDRRVAIELIAGGFSALEAEAGAQTPGDSAPGAS